MLLTPIRSQTASTTSETALSQQPAMTCGSGEITPGLFILAAERMRAYSELLQQGQDAILTLISTGIEADLFSLLLMHLNTTIRQTITHIILLPSPLPKDILTEEERKKHQQYDHSRFGETFREITGGKFTRLQHFSFTGYPLWPAQWAEFFDASENKRIQVKNLDLSIEACEISEAAVIRFLSKLPQAVFTHLQTLIISGWKDSQYASLAMQIEYRNLPFLTTVVWPDCPKIAPGESPRNPHTRPGTTLLLTLRSQGFTRTTGPEEETIFSREPKCIEYS